MQKVKVNVEIRVKNARLLCREAGVQGTNLTNIRKAGG
jgi:hypothetical protein